MDASAIRASFPSSLAGDAAIITGYLPSRYPSISDNSLSTVSIRGETVRIPYRIHLDQPRLADVKALTPQQQLMVHALYTRHHDGHLREKSLTPLLDGEYEWTPPFIVPLASEYVVEIAQVVLNSVDIVGTSSFRDFCASNVEYLLRCRQRTITYWDCYYRNAFATYRDYPGFRVIDAAIRAAKV